MLTGGDLLPPLLSASVPTRSRRLTDPRDRLIPRVRADTTAGFRLSRHKPVVVAARKSQTNPPARARKPSFKGEDHGADVVAMETHWYPSTLWDHLNCWPRAEVGETVSRPCPKFLRVKGVVWRNCSESGWSETFPPYEVSCGHALNDSLHSPNDSQVLVTHEYFFYVRIMYSVGYTVSLVSLSIALTVLCVFRKLHCTRNFIHMQLFTSFILRAIFIFIRDAALHSSQEYYHCNFHPPGCKVALFLSNYCILANYSWLLVEGHYLHSLINLSLHSHTKRLHCYTLLGWGIPMLIIISWSLAKYLHQDEGKLAKSTFLLVSLFGLQYVLFAFFPDRVNVLTFKIWNVIELALASTQGFIVALLYCFLNGEVQYEVQRRWRRWRMKQHLHGDPRVHHSSLSHSGLPLTQVSLLTRPNTHTT
ncbi:Vasoactive intestinal polypeptide receptor [Triplophysa tibetana]|uniref:Vasoactive intestinal polypeptide receptor n=1 Tax=Triplophysa tibetana TaxID=1572043 RepID=A0A5A9P2K1_9TELE|nr:Vasoactive intestinal polypeptide receptor [Triplophysa tibetana]